METWADTELELSVDLKLLDTHDDPQHVQHHFQSTQHHAEIK